ncbi:MAG: hypothetical protein OEV89_04835 [Desulfobulbaceae bacterium]|nr:hypothetical protein [Desulfobulbaceae bacterium]HIJ90073.1 hypothetical protein [Deltaproteobacteria bacterium]
MKKTCDYCGGSGQIHFFAGVSRFHLSCEECPACAGIGYELPSDDTTTQDEKEPSPAKKSPLRKKAG